MTFPLYLRKTNPPRVYKWLLDRSRVLKKGDPNYTHTGYDSWVLTGGLDLRDEGDLDAFYKAYADSWRLYRDQLGPPLFLNETANGLRYSPLIQDWDLYVSASSPPDERKVLMPLLQQFCGSLRSAFEDPRGLVFVTSSGVTKTSKDGIECFKMGVHIICPEIITDRKTRLLHRRVVVLALEDAIGTNWSGVGLHRGCSWDKTVVDKNVSERPTSRMIGSAKLVRCKCKKEKKPCPKNHFRGFYEAGRVHELFTVLDIEGTERVEERDEYSRKRVDLLKALSLRRYRDDDPNTIVVPSPLKITEHFHSERFSEGKETDEKKRKKVPVSKTAEEVIDTLLKIYWHEERSSPVECEKKTKTYTVPLKGKYCLNRFREHSSNGTYIIFKGNSSYGYMRKRCFSKNSGWFCSCEQFQEELEIPKRCLPILFGGKLPTRKPAEPIPRLSKESDGNISISRLDGLLKRMERRWLVEDDKKIEEDLLGHENPLPYLIQMQNSARREPPAKKPRQNDDDVLEGLLSQLDDPSVIE